MTSHATTEEILEAFRTLTSDECEALANAAAFWLGGTRFTEPADLISETLTLMLDGRRNWPRQMSFGPFMFATMRSVADADRQSHGGQRGASVNIDDVVDCATSLQLHTPSIEDELIATEPKRLLKRAAIAAAKELDGDMQAKGVLESIFEGLSREEACASLDMDPCAYDNARKRVYRKVRKCIGQHLH